MTTVRVTREVTDITVQVLDLVKVLENRTTVIVNPDNWTFPGAATEQFLLDEDGEQLSDEDLVLLVDEA